MKLSQYASTQPYELQSDELGYVLEKAAELERWVKDVKEYAKTLAVTKGERIKGWKLVRGKSARKYTDEQKVYDVLTEQYDPDRVTPGNLLSITALEREIGLDAFRTILQGLVVKPNGKPTLVPDRDVRPESYRNGLPRALQDFADVMHAAR